MGLPPNHPFQEDFPGNNHPAIEVFPHEHAKMGEKSIEICQNLSDQHVERSCFTPSEIWLKQNALHDPNILDSKIIQNPVLYHCNHQPTEVSTIDVPNSHWLIHRVFLLPLQYLQQQVNNDRWYTSHGPTPIYTKRTLSTHSLVMMFSIKNANYLE